MTTPSLPSMMIERKVKMSWLDQMLNLFKKHLKKSLSWGDLPKKGDHPRYNPDEYVTLTDEGEP